MQENIQSHQSSLNKYYPFKQKSKGKDGKKIIKEKRGGWGVYE